QGRVFNPADLLGNTHHLTAVAVLVVVPHIQVNLVAIHDGRFGIHNTGVAVTDEIGRYHFSRVHPVDLLLQRRMQRLFTQEVIHFFHAGFFLQVQRQNGHGHVRSRNADGVTGQQTFQFRQRLGDGFGRTGFSDHHVQRRRTTTTVTFMVVVDQVLVVGVGVNGFHVATVNAVGIIHYLQNRGNGVGGTGRGRQNLVRGVNIAVIDTVNDVFQIALARCGQQHPCRAIAVQVLRQAGFVTPHTGVVDDQGVFDAVLGIINFRRIVGVNNLDVVAVGDQCFVFGIDGQGAAEWTVNRITTQQGSALHQIFAFTTTYHDGTQTQALTAAGFFNQDTRQQATDTTNTVQNHVAVFAVGLGFANHFGQFSLQESFQILAIAFVAVFYRQLAQINVRTADFHIAQRRQDRIGIVNRQLLLLHMTHKTVCLQNIDDGTVYHRTAIHRSNNVFLAVQGTNQRNHGFCDGFTVHPVLQTGFAHVLAHGVTFR